MDNFPISGVWVGRREAVRYTGCMRNRVPDFVAVANTWQKTVTTALLCSLVSTLILFPRKTEAAVIVLNASPGSNLTWTVPADWNSSRNTIHVIGAGGGGSDNGAYGQGGGGGAYSSVSNLTLTPGASVTYRIGTGGTAGGTTGGTGGDTFFNRTAGSANTCADTVSVCAKGGAGGAAAGGGAGGVDTSGVGSVRNSGGAGAAGSSSAGTGGGGGGAAGPGGVGRAGGAGDTNATGDDGGGGGGGAGGGSSTTGTAGTTVGGPGGNGPSGSGSGAQSTVGTVGGGGGGGVNGGESAVRGGIGGPGNEFAPAFGAGGGGGGGGGAAGGSGGGGGIYGGGGGGGGLEAGPGAQGLIVITYDPIFGSHSNITLTDSVQIRGTLAITGALAKASGTFVIDHPLDPVNKLLYHSFVESLEPKNVYDGVATLDGNGEVRIRLPDYFEALNTDFRYQFFPHFEAMPDLHVKEEVRNNSFVIAGGKPRGEISWQVTGNRHDPYIVANPILNEVLKGPDQPVDVGECLHEPLCD